MKCTQGRCDVSVLRSTGDKPCKSILNILEYSDPDHVKLPGPMSFEHINVFTDLHLQNPKELEPVHRNI